MNSTENASKSWSPRTRSQGQGQPLVKFDLDAIKAKGYDLTTPVIITNSKSYQEIGDSKRGAVKAGDQLLTLS